MRSLWEIAVLGASLLPMLPACGARAGLSGGTLADAAPDDAGSGGARFALPDASPAPFDANPPEHDAACVPMTCAESLSYFCDKVGCPLHAFSLQWGDARWCTIGAVAASDAQAQDSGAYWFSVEIDHNGVSATLLYDYTSADLVFVLGPNQTLCLAGEMPPEAQCQLIMYTGVGLACH